MYLVVCHDQLLQLHGDSLPKNITSCIQSSQHINITFLRAITLARGGECKALMVLQIDINVLPLKSQTMTHMPIKLEFVLNAAFQLVFTKSSCGLIHYLATAAPSSHKVCGRPHSSCNVDVWQASSYNFAANGTYLGLAN